MRVVEPTLSNRIKNDSEIEHVARKLKYYKHNCVGTCFKFLVQRILTPLPTEHQICILCIIFCRDAYPENIICTFNLVAL